MNIQKLRCTCSACHQVFDAEIVVDAHINVAVASLRAIRCPVCGSKKIGIGGNYTNAPPISAPLAERLLWWVHRGERGASSETIYSVFADRRGLRPDRWASVPHDPDDFRRCRQLLDLIPEWRSRIKEVGLTYPWYRPFTDRWEEMDRLWDEESPSRECPRLYALMQVAREESIAIRAQAQEER